MDNSSKQRLIGVMVLVALATIVLPIAFHQSSTQNIALSIPENAPPPPPLSDVQIAPPTRQTPMTEKVAFQTEHTNESTSQSQTEAANTESLTAPDQTLSPSASEGTQPVAQRAASPAEPLASEPNAQNTASTAQAPDTTSSPAAAAVTATTEHANTPVATSMTNAVSVKPTPSIKPAAAQFPAWNVQLGSFSDEKNAQHLISTLRKNGFNAYSKPINTAQNKTITKVFIGPELHRTQAEAIVKKLQDQHHIKGFIVKHTL